MNTLELKRRVNLAIIASVLLYALIAIATYNSWDQRRKQHLTDLSELELTRARSLINIWMSQATRSADGIQILARELREKLPSEVYTATNEIPEQERERINAIFIDWLKIFRRFDHVRLISSAGYELARVNNRNEILHRVNPAELQNKGARGYVLKASQMEPNALFAQPISLNREGGEIEKPYVPVIRILMKLPSNDGADFALLVANFSVNAVFGDIRNQTETLPDREVYALNKKGYFMLGGDSFMDAEWAFEFNDRIGLNAESLIPETWAAINKTEEGVVTTGAGLFAFKNVRFEPTSSAGNTSRAGTFIAHIKPDGLYKDSLANPTLFAQSFVLFSVMYLSVFYLLIRNAKNAIQIARVAEHKEEIESQFLSNMSHEIRNPLNGISGLIRLARDESVNEEQAAHLDLAQHTCGQLKSIVDDILDIKKLEAKELKLRTESFDYHAHRASVKSMFESQIRDKQIEFINETDVDSIPRFVIGDETRMTQIASNILGNAIKFTPDGGIISTKVTYDFDSERLTFEVQDSGIGMSPESLSTLFERFKQAEEGRTKNHQGTGLGMAISKQLVGLMDGTIDVKSQLGEGTLVRVSAPLPVDWERENAWREGRLADTNPNNNNSIDLSGVRVLCVDDSNINLKVTSRALIKAGASVTTALSGKEALELLKSSECDIVLTDISMPEMDGEQFQQELKSWKTTLPVVAVTGNVLKSDVDRYLASGFVAVLAKPLDVQELLEVISKHVKRAD